ncbi:MAG TPA: alkaline phosphatase family protein, partial [Vicinamibacterales bacterium]
MTRRLSIVLLAALALTSAVVGCGPRHTKIGRRVIVLGVDGMDYDLVRDLMARGRMPQFARLAQSGAFAPLRTTVPPQSPVAWSTFMTGLDPGRTGIFDFIHRDPKTMEPFLSTSRAESSGRNIRLGRWQFPLTAGRVELLREGQPFWDVLEQHGVETSIIRMPANFPPSGKATRELSGMGTPDLLGTYGTFSFFSSNPLADRALSGGVMVPVTVERGMVHAAIDGPNHPYLVEPQKTKVEFTAYVDATKQHAQLVVGAEQRLLRVGEWSDWIPVELPLLPFEHLSGACRFYLKALDPYFELYVSPINLDPMNPELPISSPPGYAAELARATGRFYTQGMPEDTKSLKTGVLSPDEFLAQARLTEDENLRQYRYALDRFDDGLMFYYFGHIDQVSHMMWRAMDPGHPAFTSADLPYRSVVENLYIEMDGIIGETASRLRPDDLLVVMSDHGFSSWRRSFSLNSWLRDNGYLAVRDPAAIDPGLFSNVDWTRTRAYGLGLNGLYINVRGREAHGIVDAGERDRVADELARRLADTIDPKTGGRPINRMFRRENVYHVAGHEDIAPDLIVGYARGTRGSDESALGIVPRDVLTDNTDAWSGDHCMDPDVVPGILLVSRRLRQQAPSLETL